MSENPGPSPEVKTASPYLSKELPSPFAVAQNATLWLNNTIIQELEGLRREPQLIFLPDSATNPTSPDWYKEESLVKHLCFFDPGRLPPEGREKFIKKLKFINSEIERLSDKKTSEANKKERMEGKIMESLQLIYPELAFLQKYDINTSEVALREEAKDYYDSYQERHKAPEETTVSAAIPTAETSKIAEIKARLAEKFAPLAESKIISELKPLYERVYAGKMTLKEMATKLTAPQIEAIRTFSRYFETLPQVKVGKKVVTTGLVSALVAISNIACGGGQAQQTPIIQPTEVVSPTVIPASPTVTTSPTEVPPTAPQTQQPTEKPTETATAVPPTPTEVPPSPTAKPTLTEQQVINNYIEGDGQTMIGYYANDFGFNPVDVTKRLEGQGAVITYNDYKGNPFKVLIDPQTGKPLFVITSDNVGHIANPKLLARLGGFDSGTYTGGYGSVKDYNQLIATQKRDFNGGAAYINWIDIYNNGYSAPDNDYNLAKQFDQTVVGHIIWSVQIPPDVVNLPPDQFKAKVFQFVEDTLTRYKGADYITLVNEPRPDDILSQKMGQDYPVGIFQHAKEVLKKIGSKTKIGINDDLNHTPPTDDYNGTRTESTEQWLTKLSGNVDFVGLQMPIDASRRPSKQDIINQIKKYHNQYGVDVLVTELSVNMRNVGGSESYRRQLQADTYKDVIEALCEARDDNGNLIVKGEYILGLIDRLSPFERDPKQWGYAPNSEPLPYGDNFDYKPAFFGMTEGLLALFQNNTS